MVDAQVGTTPLIEISRELVNIFNDFCLKNLVPVRVNNTSSISFLDIKS